MLLILLTWLVGPAVEGEVEETLVVAHALLATLAQLGGRSAEPAQGRRLVARRVPARAQFGHRRPDVRPVQRLVVLGVVVRGEVVVESPAAS